MADRYHISNLIVWVRPGRLAVTKAEISIIPNVQIAETDGKAKLIIVIETQSHSQSAERLRAIEALQDVLNVSLIYHHVEEAAGAKRRVKPLYWTSRADATIQSRFKQPQLPPASLPERRPTPPISSLKESLRS